MTEEFRVDSRHTTSFVVYRSFVEVPTSVPLFFEFPLYAVAEGRQEGKIDSMMQQECTLLIHFYVLCIEADQSEMRFNLSKQIRTLKGGMPMTNFVTTLNPVMSGLDGINVERGKRK